MNVNQLIEALKQFPGHLPVVFSTQEDTYAANPDVKKWDFDHNYWDGMEIKTIKANEEFVEL